jgi:tRNA-splicing ligase RtcB
VIAVETDLHSDHLPDSLDPLLRQIERRIPAGVGHGHDARTAAADRWFTDHHPKRWRREPLTPKQEKRAIEQFGTLGAGNHHVEICLDERDVVWAELHSGSRGIGNQLATMHIDRARKSAEKDSIDLEDRDLAYFREGTADFDDYIADMLWAQDYALANREQMMDVLLELLFGTARFGTEVRRINCHHNYSARERHDDRELWITRKGAIRARAEDEGVIPGSMATGTYIVHGRGNPASYDSSAHGAGRRHSRRQAKKRFTVEQLEKHMTGKAWNRDRARALLDEIPDAYKDVESVMDDQRDLVEVEHVLRQVLNYKGS